MLALGIRILALVMWSSISLEKFVSEFPGDALQAGCKRACSSRIPGEILCKPAAKHKVSEYGPMLFGLPTQKRGLGCRVRVKVVRAWARGSLLSVQGRFTAYPRILHYVLTSFKTWVVFWMVQIGPRFRSPLLSPPSTFSVSLAGNT